MAATRFLEDVLDDQITVDRHRDALAQVRAGHSVDPIRCEGDRLDDAGLTLDEPVAEVGLVLLAGQEDSGSWVITSTLSASRSLYSAFWSV